MEVFETSLPGIGVRFEFEASSGSHVGVIVHRDGRRELVVYDTDDPDSARETVRLTESESATLVELLGGSKVTERLGELRYDVEGLALEWITLPPNGGLTGQTIEAGAVRTRTGASVVAVIRGEQSIPGPGPDFRFEEGDVALVVGSLDGVHAASDVLSG